MSSFNALPMLGESQIFKNTPIKVKTLKNEEGCKGGYGLKLI